MFLEQNMENVSLVKQSRIPNNPQTLFSIFLEQNHGERGLAGDR